MQACSGIMALTGEPERPPVRVRVSIIDVGTGLWCTVGILGALYQRKLTVRGCIIDASLYQTAVAWTANQSMMVRVGTIQGRGRRDRHTKRAQPKRTSGSAPSFAKINQPVTARVKAHQRIAIPRPPNGYDQSAQAPLLPDRRSP